MPYGVFIGFEGGRDGLLHVSEMSHSRIESVEDEFEEGDKVKFKIVDVDERTGKLRLSRKAIMPRADGTIPTDEELEEERKASKSRGRDRGERRGGGGRDRGDRRGGGGRDRRNRD
jgi:polyribonucleotide nucleotidyltransferase